MQSEIRSVAIAGVGFVGGACANYFQNFTKLETILYDPFKSLGSVEEMNRADAIFVCAPTPYVEGSGYDDSAVKDVLSKVAEGKLVVLKSTILPGSTQKFQEQHPKLNILFNPEFLVQATANEDFLKPERQIVGYTEQSKEHAEAVMRILPDAAYKKVMPATEAELVKYFGNTFLALKVVFANQFFDLCQKLGADYQNVKEAAVHDSRIGQSHLDINFDGYRGYAGACFPKDMRALIQLGKELNQPMELLEKAETINNELRKSAE